MKKLSIIIPAFNCEKYIEECIESIYKEKFKGIEVIIVDDGSTDNTLEKIYVLKEKYKDLIIIKQKNGGPGKARNEGLKLATGEFITFVDSDDYIPKGTLKHVHKAITERCADIYIGNILCFNDVRTWHLSYMKDIFKCKGIEYCSVKMNSEILNTPSVCNKWFRNSLIKDNNIKFEEDINVGEDLLFTKSCYEKSNKIIRENRDIYAYRLISNESLISKTAITFFEDLFKLQEILSLTSNDEYEKIIYRQIKFFIDSIFLKYKNLEKSVSCELMEIGIKFFRIRKINILELEKLLLQKEKYLLTIMFINKDRSNIKIFMDKIIDGNVSKKIVIENKVYFSYLYREFPKYKEYLKISPIVLTKIENVKLEEDELTFRGYGFIKGIQLCEKGKLKQELLFIDSKGNEKSIDLENDYRTDLTYLYREDNVNYHWGGFKPIKIKLLRELQHDDEYEVKLRISVDGCIFLEDVTFKLAEVKNKLKVRYIEQNAITKEIFCKFNNGTNLIIRIKSLNKAQCIKSKIRKLRRDLRYDKSLLVKGNYKSFIVIYLNRIVARYIRSLDIWFMGERSDTAQDNTYHLFRYIRLNKKNINAKYVIDYDSKDIQNIIKFGNVVRFGSIMHTIYLLNSKFTINSYAERPNMYTKEYLDVIKYYPEYIKNKKIFLQHGVIGVSRVNHVLHKNRMDYDMFIVSSEFEKNHIIEEFGYENKEVVVTGLARWDNLNSDNVKNEILLMPTWRSWIKTEDELFKSEYFQKYLELIQNKQVNRLLKENNMILNFYPHYQTQKLLNKLNLKLSDRVKIIRQEDKSVQALINENSILITDYSTVSFDFEYIKKSVIFYQFDYDQFYKKHYNEGPIDHKNELFGKVCYEVDEVIKNLQNYIEKGYNDSNRLGDKYIANRERNHSKHIFNNILEL